MSKNASFYIADPSMFGSKLFDSLQAIESYEGLSQGGSATGLLLKTSWGKMTVSIMPQEQVPEHLRGLEGYIRHHISDEDDSIYALSRLYYVAMCLGCVIEVEAGQEEQLHQFLFAFNNALNGLMFLQDTIWDWSGEPLCGPHK